jgi:acetylornithine deacetylase/succinyl-diaminopimelate desuccinylase-like protein
VSSEVVELLRTMIRNECVNTGLPESGQEQRSVATLLDYFGVEGQIFEPAPGRQSLVYRIAGTDPDAPSLAMVPHLDVVPADPDGWTQDPFAADIVDGFVYGRGAVDMLNIVAACAQAVRPYIRGDLQPRGDLIFAAVADEEAGGMKGSYRLTRDHWDLVGADFMLTEVAYPRAGTSPAIPVSVGEKGSFFARLRTTGVPAHGSSPYGTDNALEKMVHALHNLLATPSPAEIGTQWTEFVDGIGLAHDVADALKDPDRVDEAIDKIAETDPVFASYVHASTHLTISANQARMGTKANIVADRAKTELDIRALPGMTRESVDAYVRHAMGPAGDAVEIESRSNNPASISSADTAMWRAIAEGVYDLEGHRKLIPTLMPVATDARFWRKRGVGSYGVGLYDDQTTFSDLLSRFHGHDERVSVQSVERTAALYERILHHLGR